MQALEEVKVREGTIAELQKKIQESDAKLKQQQNLCAVRFVAHELIFSIVLMAGIGTSKCAATATFTRRT